MTSDEPRPDRCAAKCRDGGYCEQYPVEGTERCRMHGGSTPKGKDSPHTVHGLRSQYLDDEDRELYEQVQEHEPAEIILEQFHFTYTKILRAARESGGNSAEEIVRDLVECIDSGAADEDTVGALAELLGVSNKAVDRSVGRLIDLAREYRQATDGETINLEHSGQIDGERTHKTDEETRRAVQSALAERYGIDE